MIKHNLGYKLLSLVIAILVWAYVSQYVDQGRSAMRVTRDLTLPLTVRNLQDGLVVTSKPDTVQVLLEGPKEYVDTITAEPDSVTANIFMNRIDEGHHRLPIIVKLPAGYTGLVSTTPRPQETMVDVEKTAQRTVPIEAEFTTSAPVGFRFSAPRISPDKAVVAGMAALVNNVSRLVITIGAGAPTSGLIDGEFPVQALDQDGKTVEDVVVIPSKARAHLELERAPASKVVFITPTIMGSPRFPYKVSGIELQPETITLNGRPEKLTSISTVSTEPLALSDRTKTFSQRVRLIAPEGTLLAHDKYVTITVKIAGSEAGAPGGG